MIGLVQGGCIGTGIGQTGGASQGELASDHGSCAITQRAGLVRLPRYSRIRILEPNDAETQGTRTVSAPTIPQKERFCLGRLFGSGCFIHPRRTLPSIPHALGLPDIFRVAAG
jgi:hypothetical protein